MKFNIFRSNRALLVLCLCSLMVFTSTASAATPVVTPAKTQSAPDQSFVYSIPMVNASNSNVTIDGHITRGEYGQTFLETKSLIQVNWEYDVNTIRIGLVSPGTGYIGVGWGTHMKDANIIIGGYVASNSTPYIYDCTGLSGFAVGTAHGEDTSMGGTDDIISFAASENATNTILEFTFPMKPSDSLDPQISPNTVTPMFFAYQDSMDSFAIHTARSNVDNVFYKPQAVKVTPTITVNAPASVDYGKALILNATVEDSSGKPIPGLELSIYRQTVFGPMLLNTSATDANGMVYFNSTFVELSGNITFIVENKEVVQMVNSVITSISSVQTTTLINFQPQPNPGPSITDLLSKYGLLTAFWLMGIFIWATMSYNLYAIAQIIYNRNEPMDGEE